MMRNRAARGLLLATDSDENARRSHAEACRSLAVRALDQGAAGHRACVLAPRPGNRELRGPGGRVFVNRGRAMRGSQGSPTARGSCCADYDADIPARADMSAVTHVPSRHGAPTGPRIRWGVLRHRPCSLVGHGESHGSGWRQSRTHHWWQRRDRPCCRNRIRQARGEGRRQRTP